MADPGWYKDRADPALARWFDGENWTEHTLVRAEQTPGVLPPPPAGWKPPEPEPEPWSPPAWSPPTYVPPARPAAPERPVEAPESPVETSPAASVASPESPEAPAESPVAPLESPVEAAAEPVEPPAEPVEASAEPVEASENLPESPAQPVEPPPISLHFRIAPDPATAEPISEAVVPGGDAPAEGDAVPAAEASAADEAGPVGFLPPIDRTPTTGGAEPPAATGSPDAGAEAAGPGIPFTFTFPSLGGGGSVDPPAPEHVPAAPGEPAAVAHDGDASDEPVHPVEPVGALESDDGVDAGAPQEGPGPERSDPAVAQGIADDPADDIAEPGPASHLEHLAPQGPNAAPVAGPAAFEEPTFIGPPASRLAALPRWARFAIAALIVLAVVAALVTVAGADSSDERRAVSVDEAVSVAQAGIAGPIPEAKVRSMVEQLCGAARSGTSASAVILAKQLPVGSRGELRTALDAMGEAARRRCPDAVVDWDGLVDDVYGSAASAFDA